MGTPVEGEETAETEEVEEVNPIVRIQAILGELDPSALVLGFATVVEWVEADGSRAMSVIGTEMDPWHAYGLLTYARQSCQYGSSGYLDVDDDEIDEDDI